MMQAGQDNPTMGHALEMGAAFNQSLGKALDYNRALIEDTTQFAVNESRNFINLRLERAHQALAQLESCNGIAGLAGVQQAWMRDFMQDYADQGVRYAQAFQGAARNSVAAVIAAQAPLAKKVQDVAHDMAQDAQHVAETAEHAAEDNAGAMAHAAQDTMHNGAHENAPQWQG